MAKRLSLNFEPGRPGRWQAIWPSKSPPNKDFCWFCWLHFLSPLAPPDTNQVAPSRVKTIRELKIAKVGIGRISDKNVMSGKCSQIAKYAKSWPELRVSLQTVKCARHMSEKRGVSKVTLFVRYPVCPTPIPRGVYAKIWAIMCRKIFRQLNSRSQVCGTCPRIFVHNLWNRPLVAWVCSRSVSKFTHQEEFHW